MQTSASSTAEASQRDADATPRPKRRLGRLLLLVAFIATLLGVSHALGWTEHLNPESIKTLLVSAGLCGAIWFTLAFVAGNVLQLPGMLFVTAGVVSYGGLTGAVIALLASVIAVSATFLVVRLIGGKLLAGSQRPLLKKMLAKVQKRPVRNIAVLRTFFQTSPALNAALAMTDVRFRDYLVGSMAGMVVPVAVVFIVSEASGLV